MSPAHLALHPHVHTLTSLRRSTPPKCIRCARPSCVTSVACRPSCASLAVSKQHPHDMLRGRLLYKFLSWPYLNHDGSVGPNLTVALASPPVAGCCTKCLSCPCLNHDGSHGPFLHNSAAFSTCGAQGNSASASSLPAWYRTYWSSTTRLWPGSA